MQPKSTHSKIGASSMHRWSECPGSVRLSVGIESKSSVYAEEGNRAHGHAAHILESGNVPVGIPTEMYEAIKVYIDCIQDDLRRDLMHEPAEILVEHKFDLSTIHPGLYGTADCVVYFRDTKLLRVYDYKHGAGLSVEVQNNKQLMYYGLGALLSTGHPCMEVELVIVQPRCPHPDGVVRRWKFEAIELLDFAADLKTYAVKTEDPKAPLFPGEWCRFCPANGVCPALESKALVVAKEEFKPTLSYDPKKLSHTLEMLPTVEAWIKGVREFAYNEAQHGRTPPGFKLVQKRATRRWKNEELAGEEVRSRTNIPSRLLYDSSLKSPAQIEKLAKDKMPLLHDLIESVSSGYTLAPDSDKRVSIKLDPKSEFTKLT